jgi:hypothetical protein
VWLIWRLFLFVPLFAEVALFSPLGNAGSNQLPAGVRPMNILIWGAIVLVYGVIFYGPSAVALGGLGWMIVRRTLLPLRVSKITFIALGTLTGAVVGGCFEIIYRLVAVWTWVSASIAGGAAGGIIVGWYVQNSHRYSKL